MVTEKYTYASTAQYLCGTKSIFANFTRNGITIGVPTNAKSSISVNPTVQKFFEFFAKTAPGFEANFEGKEHSFLTAFYILF